jgi:hypothetical protein
MHPMHARCHDAPAQHAFHRLRQAGIAVAEHGCCVEQNLKNQRPEGRHAENRDHSSLDHHRKDDLSRMEAQSRTDIKL